MSARDITLAGEDGQQAMVVKAGSGWAVLCIDIDAPVRCPNIIGWSTRTRAIHGAEWHLRWHDNGKPICVDCGRWLSRKGAKYCPKGTCEATS